MSNDLERETMQIEPLCSLEGFKCTHVLRVVEACNGDLLKAATLLAVTPDEVVRWLRESLRDPERQT